jgi:hypothetical protein
MKNVYIERVQYFLILATFWQFYCPISVRLLILFFCKKGYTNTLIKSVLFQSNEYFWIACVKICILFYSFLLIVLYYSILWRCTVLWYCNIYWQYIHVLFCRLSITMNLLSYRLYSLSCFYCVLYSLTFEIYFSIF